MVSQYRKYQRNWVKHSLCQPRHQPERYGPARAQVSLWLGSQVSSLPMLKSLPELVGTIHEKEIIWFKVTVPMVTCPWLSTCCASATSRATSCAIFNRSSLEGGASNIWFFEIIFCHQINRILHLSGSSHRYLWYVVTLKGLHGPLHRDTGFRQTWHRSKSIAMVWWLATSHHSLLSKNAYISKMPTTPLMLAPHCFHLDPHLEVWCNAYEVMFMVWYMRYPTYACLNHSHA